VKNKGPAIKFKLKTVPIQLFNIKQQGIEKITNQVFFTNSYVASIWFVVVFGSGN
jgi:hypothetical protein